MDPIMADMAKVLIETCFGEYNGKYRGTEEGLGRLMQNKYNGNVDDFRERFFKPSLELLKCLKTQGFPLSTSKYQLVHLISPDVPCEAGDMFFQVGNSTPGTLSLKFTKYNDIVRNVVKLQNSHIPENKYRVAFTDHYLKSLRKRASECGRIGDMLMRTCIVITRGGKVTRVGTSNVMAEIRVNMISSMSPEQKQAIAEKLDMEFVRRTSGGRDDWLGLAKRLEDEGSFEEGFAVGMDVEVAQSSRSPTMKLLVSLERSYPSYPTPCLLDHLERMKRMDAVEAFNNAHERRRKKDWPKNRSQTFDTGELRRPKQESGTDPSLPDTADRLHSDVKFQRSNTMPTPTQVQEETSAPVQPVSDAVPESPHELQPASVPVQPVSNTVPTPTQPQQPASVPVQPVSDHAKEPHQISQPQNEASESESVKVDLQMTESASNELQATPVYPPTNNLQDNPAYPEVEAAVTSSHRTFQNPQPIAVRETHQSSEPENNPSNPEVSEAVIGPTASALAELSLEAGNSNSSGGTGLVGQTATEANQEYPSAESAVQ